MSNSETPNPIADEPITSDTNAPEPVESFKDIFSDYEQSHSRKKEPGAQGREGTVITLTADSVILDIGFKTEGVLPLTAFPADKPPKPGDKLQVTVKGRDPEGYYELTRGKIEQVTDWASLEKAFAEKSTIVGTVTGVVKGGVSVDVGVRAFMPASRSGTKDAAELAKLVEQEIRCRIIKLDVADEDVVVDRRAIAEDEERAGKERRYSELKEGVRVQGEIRSLTDYGAFVDIGGADALLHVGEISLAPHQQAIRRALRRPADRSRDHQDRSGKEAHRDQHEAASTASVGRHRRQIQSGRTRTWNRHSPHGFRRIRRNRAGHRRSDSHFRNVLG